MMTGFIDIYQRKEEASLLKYSLEVSGVTIVELSDQLEIPQCDLQLMSRGVIEIKSAVMEFVNNTIGGNCSGRKVA